MLICFLFLIFFFDCPRTHFLFRDSELKRTICKHCKTLLVPTISRSSSSYQSLGRVRIHCIFFIFPFFFLSFSFFLFPLIKRQTKQTKVHTKLSHVHIVEKLAGSEQTQILLLQLQQQMSLAKWRVTTKKEISKKKSKKSKNNNKKKNSEREREDQKEKKEKKRRKKNNNNNNKKNS